MITKKVEIVMKEKITRFVTVVKRRRVLVAIMALIAISAVAAASLWGRKADASDYITARVERGNLQVTVSATGTVQAVTTVQVGSQVSGTVTWLGADFNSPVKRGQVIARLDPAIFQAQVDNARANVVNAEAAVQAAASEINNQKANVMAAKANQDVARVQSKDAQALVKRYQELKNVLSGRELEAAQAQANAAAARYEQATAQVGQAEAVSMTSRSRLEQAKAALTQARAQLQQASVNLEHGVITAPIDGVVVSRNVDVGQTVAASLQAPTLFTIANDLTKMQVLASIDEADVGQVRKGIRASFTVDAYPGERFEGQVLDIRLNAQTLQNVVTYTAVIDVSNPELKLRPGMTTNITFPVAESIGTLMVPNAALRFTPTLTEQEQKELREKMEARRQERQSERQAAGEGGERAGQESRRRDGGPQQGNAAAPGDQARPSGGEGGQRRQGQMVWVLAVGEKIEPRFVRTGITNGRMTEIISGDINDGDTIVIGMNEGNGSARTPQQPTTPFGQRPPGGPGGGPRGR